MKNITKMHRKATTAKPLVVKSYLGFKDRKLPKKDYTLVMGLLHWLKTSTSTRLFEIFPFFLLFMGKVTTYLVYICNLIRDIGFAISCIFFCLT